MDNKEKVIKAFKDSEEPLNATKVSQISGVDKKEVDKIMKDLKKDETIISPKRCYWALKWYSTLKINTFFTFLHFGLVFSTKSLIPGYNSRNNTNIIKSISTNYINDL